MKCQKCKQKKAKFRFQRKWMCAKCYDESVKNISNPSLRLTSEDRNVGRLR